MNHQHYWKEDKAHPKTGLVGTHSYYDCPCGASKHEWTNGVERTVTITELNVRHEEIMNCDRAAFAEVAVNAFTAHTGLSADDMASKMSDLVADMMHLSDAYGLDWIDEIFQPGVRTYDVEVKEEKAAAE